MKIAILGAMREEIEPILEQIKTYESITYANNTFYKASFASHELIIAYSKVGKVNAALTASMMIEKFKAQIMLFMGVAGGINQDLKILDMLYATSLCQHDVDITAFGHPFGYFSEGSVFIKTDEKLNALALKVAKQNNIELKSGVIATGDQFICNEDKKSWIKETFQADALEMEGASVAVVCEALDIPCFVLRAITDVAAKDAEFDNDKYLSLSATKCADFIVKMLQCIH